MKLLIAAGGTGGHIFPGISVAEALLAQGAHEVVFAGTQYGLEERLIPQNGYKLARIEARPFSGTSVGAKAQTILAVQRGTLQAWQLIKAEKPDAILGMGGFTSVPVVLAGLFSRVPCFIHEQNISPGMANRLLAGRVKAVFVSFAETAHYLKARFIQAIRSARRCGGRGTQHGVRRSPYSSSGGAGGRGA
jgi:UDP-N-acetylglucosamine--N-acetylmuramyl-(pentapeptide) pyrophosphoryl-undecaprenol N-acetylglucosamine transferase